MTQERRARRADILFRATEACLRTFASLGAQLSELERRSLAQLLRLPAEANRNVGLLALEFPIRSSGDMSATSSCRGTASKAIGSADRGSTSHSMAASSARGGRSTAASPRTATRRRYPATCARSTACTQRHRIRPPELVGTFSRSCGSCTRRSSRASPRPAAVVTQAFHAEAVSGPTGKQALPLDHAPSAAAALSYSAGATQRIIPYRPDPALTAAAAVTLMPASARMPVVSATAPTRSSP
jgi:hypothetical protein